MQAGVTCRGVVMWGVGSSALQQQASSIFRHRVLGRVLHDQGVGREGTKFHICWQDSRALGVPWRQPCDSFSQCPAAAWHSTLTVS
jgi:hypothetical protein